MKKHENYESYPAYSIVEKILKLKIGQKLTLWSSNANSLQPECKKDPPNFASLRGAGGQRRRPSRRPTEVGFRPDATG